MKLTKEEKEQISRQRKEREDAERDARLEEQYENCYCRDEWGNWL